MESRKGLKLCTKDFRIRSYSGPHFSRIFPHLDWTRRDHLSVFRPNARKFGKYVDQSCSKYGQFLCNVKILQNFEEEEGHWHVYFWVILQWFNVGEIMRSAQYGHLTLLKLFSDKVNLDIDVINEAVFQCDVPVVEIFFRCWESAKWWCQYSTYSAGIYLLKVNNRNTRTRCEICLKLTINVPELRHWRHSGIIIVNFEHISHLAVVFLSLNLNRLLPAG